jgi:hypothetical protein
VADIFRSHGSGYREAFGSRLARRHFRAMRAIEICRTSELGGHVDECDSCGALRISYNSCRNRHCPKCQGLDKERWLESRKRELLPTRYFHLVFTLSADLRPLALRNQKVFYNMLFRSVGETLKESAENNKHLGAEIGFIAILHTWTRTLMDHPHIHCLVPGGGLSADGSQWIGSRKKFFILVKVLSRLFRGKFLAYLRKAYDNGELLFPGKISRLEEKTVFSALLSDLYEQEWVVYCKPPLSGERVIDYLGRYTHRVAITNDRIVKLEGNRVTIRYRDSRDHDRVKLMTLDAFEFIRRFLLHILPDGFMKVRHYGILSNRNNKTKLFQAQVLLNAVSGNAQKQGHRESWQELLIRVTGVDPRLCPFCDKGRMVLKEPLLPLRNRYPP